MPDIPLRTIGLIGAPLGRLNDWLTALLDACAVADQQVRPLYRMKRGEKMSARFPHPAITPRVYLSTANPAADVLGLIADGGIPSVFAHERPEDVVLDLMRDQAFGFRDALSEASGCLTLAYASNAARNAIHLHRDITEPVHAVVSAVLAHLAVTLLPEAVPKVMAAVSTADDPEGRTTLAETLMRWRPAGSKVQPTATGEDGATIGLSADEVRIIHEAVGVSAADRLMPSAAPFVWSPELLICPDDTTRPVPEWIDVLGPARVLVEGPHFAMPPGIYELEFSVEPSATLVPQPCSLEVHAGVRLARTVFDLDRAVPQSGRFSFVHDQPGHSVDVRLRSERGTIDGELRFLGFSLRLIEALTLSEIAAQEPGLSLLRTG